MFVMVSGALLLSKDREFSIKRLLLHYLPKTVLVLLFWGIFYHLYHTQNFSLANVWIGVKNLLQAEAYSHLWYLYMLIGLYIATPIVKSYVNHASKENLLYFLLVGACITCVAPFLFQFARFAKLKPLYDALYLSNGVSYIVYYVLGYYLMNFPPSLKVRRALYIVGGTGLLGAAFFGEYMSFVREKAVSYLGYFSPFTFLFCIALFVFMQQLFDGKKTRISAGRKQKMTWMGKLTFGIYLIHYAVEKELLHLGFHSNFINPLFGVPIVSLGVFAVSLAISWILSRIPWVRKLIS